MMSRLRVPSLALHRAARRIAPAKTSSGRARITNIPPRRSARNAACAARASEGCTFLRDSRDCMAFTSSNSPSANKSFFTGDFDVYRSRNVFALAASLQPLELIHGLVKMALEAGFVAEDPIQRILIRRIGR